MDLATKQVRNRNCISVLLIFFGVIFMQIIAYMICVVAYIGIQMLQGMGTSEAFQNMVGYMTNTNSSLLMWVSAVSATLCLVWCGVLYYKSSWRVKPFSYRKAFSLQNVAAIIGIGMGGCVFLSIAVTVLSLIFPGAFTSYNNLVGKLNISNSAITAVYAIVIGPCSEEVIFRGAIRDRLKIAFPFWTANILQALCFGIYHMNFIQGAYAFCLGIVLGLVVEVTGSIFASIITHMLFNGTTFLLSLSGIGKNAVTLGIVIPVSIIIMVAGIYYFLAAYKERIKSKKNE